MLLLSVVLVVVVIATGGVDDADWSSLLLEAVVMAMVVVVVGVGLFCWGKLVRCCMTPSGTYGWPRADRSKRILVRYCSKVFSCVRLYRCSIYRLWSMSMLLSIGVVAVGTGAGAANVVRQPSIFFCVLEYLFLFRGSSNNQTCVLHRTF